MTKRSRVIALLVVFLSLDGGTAALAYWMASGSGTGAVRTNAVPSSLAAIQSGTIAGVDPGVPAQLIHGTFTNSGTERGYVTSVTVSITVAAAPDAPTGVCTTDDYTLTGATMPVDAEIPVGTGVGSWGGATLAFNDNATVTQDACKGATITLHYTVQ